ncbi:MAG TPA: cobalamin-dependent protein, partial [Solirubrobacteraceae bacterium]|nr:cobalamin-dependent protein [Solirubrobacteraceae bacterium]
MSIALPSEAPQGAETDGPPLRFVTAASLFDGHDAAINVIRRLIQDRGAEVIHLGHNRSVVDIVRAAIQEDADAIAISSYQGGHLEFFTYALQLLREQGAEHIRVFGGGGGTITPQEISELEGAGIERLYHPNDGMALGLTGMIDDLMRHAHERRLPVDSEAKLWTFCAKDDAERPELPPDDLTVARMLSALEDGALDDTTLERL